MGLQQSIVFQVFPLVGSILELPSGGSTFVPSIPPSFGGIPPILGSTFEGSCFFSISDISY